MVIQHKPRDVTKVLESVRWSSRLLLIASHGEPFQSSAQTTSSCCLSLVRTLRWSITIPEDVPTTLKRVGFSFTNASTAVSKRCHRSDSCRNAWRLSVTSKKGRGIGRPNQGGPQKREPMDEYQTETAYSE